MKITDITGTPREANGRVWDYAAVVQATTRIVSISWTFDTQSKNVRTPTVKAPNYKWTSDGSKKVTVVIVGNKGEKVSLSKTFYVGKKPAPKPTPTPTPPPTPAPKPIPSSGGLKVYSLPSDLTQLSEGVFEIKNFNKGQNSTKSGASNYGAQVNSSVIGQGSAVTKLQLIPHSSTKKSAVPVVKGNGGGLANPTNNMYILRVDGNERILRGFSIIGSEQGHMYNGLRLDRIRDLTMEDVAVFSIPGNASGNPGETFLINGQRLSGKAIINNLKVIGGTGALRSAAGLGFNSTTAKIYISGLLTKAMHESAGIATWQQTGDMEIHGWTHDAPTRNFGAERLAADVKFVDPINMQLRTIRGKHDATYTWGDHEGGEYRGGSITWEFSSDTALKRYLIPGRNKIYVLTNKQSNKQGIKKSVRITVAGKDRTSSLLQWAGA